MGKRVNDYFTVKVECNDVEEDFEIHLDILPESVLELLKEMAEVSFASECEACIDRALVKKKQF